MELSHRKFWSLVALTFVLGMVFSAKGAETPPASTEIVTAAERQSLDALNRVDLQIFEASLEVINAQQIALDVSGAIIGQYPYVSVNDLEAGTKIVNQQASHIEAANEQLNRLQQERQAILTD
jgi:hypothetical protein